MRFAHLKIHHGFERMGLRGLSGARDEFLLAAIVQNLKTLALRFTRATTHLAARIVCLRSLMLGQSRPRRGRRQSSGRKTQQPAHLSPIKTALGHNANRKTYFLNSIDPSQTSAQRGGRTIGPATSVTNGAFDADPTRAARNNGLQCSPYTTAR
jgi:hypothetical protein